MPGNFVGVNDDDSLDHRAMSAASVDFPDRLRPSMPTSNGAVCERCGSTRASMSGTGTIAHSVVEHLPLTAIHLLDAVFGRGARCRDEPHERGRDRRRAAPRPL
jgi:hypothetical protein